MNSKQIADSEIGVCICLNGTNNYLTELVLNTLQSTTNYHFRLYIACLSDNVESKTKNYLDLLSKKGHYVCYYDTSKSYIEAMNVLLSIVYQKYTCIFPSNVLVNSMWLESMISQMKHIDKTGICGIKNQWQYANMSLTTFLKRDVTEPDELYTYALQTPMNLVRGLVCFETNTVRDLKYLNTSLQHANRSIDELSARVYQKGLNNYYILESMCFEIPQSIYNVNWESYNKESDEEFKNHLKLLLKNKYNNDLWN